MNLSTRTAAPRNSMLPVAGFGILIAGLLALILLFDGSRVALDDGIERLTAASTKTRIVYVETEPMGAAAASGEGLALRFRIGLQGKRVAKRLEQVMPQFYGEMLRDLTADPVSADPQTGKLDLLAVEGRVRGMLDSMLGAGVVETVRVSEVRRRPI